MNYKAYSSIRKLFAFVGLFFLAVGSVQASLIVEDLGGGVTQVTIDPIDLTASSAGEGDFLVIEDYWAVTSTGCGAGVSTTMSYSINGGAAVFPAQYNCTGRYTGDFHGFDSNDLAFDFNSGFGTDIIAAVGDIITFAGSFTFSNNLNGIASTGGPYSIHLSGESGIIAESRIFEGERPATVPLPSTLSLFAIGLLALGLRRRPV